MNRRLEPPDGGSWFSSIEDRRRFAGAHAGLFFALVAIMWLLYYLEVNAYDRGLMGPGALLALHIVIGYGCWCAMGAWRFFSEWRDYWDMKARRSEYEPLPPVKRFVSYVRQYLLYMFAFPVLYGRNLRYVLRHRDEK